MAVNFRDPVDSDVVNAAYLSKVVGGDTIGKIGLKNEEVESGSAVTNLQRAINKLFSATGVGNEINGSSNEYSSQNFVTDGQPYKEAIEALDAEVMMLIGILTGQIDELFEGTYRFRQFETDTDYENALLAAEEPLEGGESYYNTAVNRLRYYDSDAEKWVSVDPEMIAKQETPTGDVDGTNKEFKLSYLPISEESLLVYVNGVMRSDWVFDYNTAAITLDEAPALGQEVKVFYLTQGVPSQPILSMEPIVEYITLIEDDILAKEVALGAIPDNLSHIKVDVCRSTMGALILGVDFAPEHDLDESEEIVGAKLVWDSLGFESDAEEGQTLRISYFVRGEL